MAYNKRYNPDALPAHVEPEQASKDTPPGRDKKTTTANISSPKAAALLTQRPPQSRTSPNPQAPPPQGRLPQNQSYSRPPQDQSYARPPQSYSNSTGSAPRFDSRPPPQQQANSGHYRQGSGGGSGGSGFPGSPVPSAYGHGRLGPPPTTLGRPPAQNRPPSTGPPLPPPRDGNDREALWPLFRQVDRDGTFSSYSGRTLIQLEYFLIFSPSGAGFL